MINKPSWDNLQGSIAEFPKRWQMPGSESSDSQHEVMGVSQLGATFLSVPTPQTITFPTAHPEPPWVSSEECKQKVHLPHFLCLYVVRGQEWPL